MRLQVQSQLTPIAPITAISAPGIFGVSALSPTITPSTEADTATVARLASGIWPRVSMNFSIAPPLAAPGTPSMPATCPIATWMPTPVRKPINTLRDRKSARNPSRTRRASSRNAPVAIATMPASET